MGDNLVPNGLSQAFFEFSKIPQNRLCLQYVCKRVAASLARPKDLNHAISGSVFPPAGQLRNAIPVGATCCRSARSRSDPVPKRSARMHRARQRLHGWVDHGLYARARVHHPGAEKLRRARRAGRGLQTQGSESGWPLHGSIERLLESPDFAGCVMASRSRPPHGAPALLGSRLG